MGAESTATVSVFDLTWSELGDVVARGICNDFSPAWFLTAGGERFEPKRLRRSPKLRLFFSGPAADTETW